MIKTAGKAFDPKERHILFLAGTSDTDWPAASAMHGSLLVAANEVEGKKMIEQIEGLIRGGAKVLLDSGIFWLANQHKDKHGITMDQALALAPSEIDGFKELREKYLELVHRFGADSWGYIEMDQGGMKNKIKTREALERGGLRPIPVYHPLNDGWEYFDYLAGRYDRICFGNVVQADQATRLRLLSTAWERHRMYPSLWIHALGLTPNEMVHAYPVDSCDSSAWTISVRFPGAPDEFADCRTLGDLRRDFQYNRSHPDLGEHYCKAKALNAYICRFQQTNWRRHTRDLLKALGAESLYPRVNDHVSNRKAV